MKIHPTFNIQHRTPNTERLAGRPHSKLGVECSMFNVSPSVNPQSAIRHSPFESGIALVITLILLAVTLVMAIAFLAVARRERNSVTTAADTTTARLAADTALAAAQAQIAANLLATRVAAYNYGLLVSTNYINSAGFDPASSNPTNVNYDHLINSSVALNADQLDQNIANLYLLPRAPVFIPTNSLGSNDFRFYLDLNRNGQFDGNQLLPVISSDPNNPYYNTNGLTMPAIIPGNTLSNINIGDPEWIGVLEHPDQPHSANNPFVARYAFLAQPAGNSLDLNYIHNQTMTATVNPAASGKDGYFRNEGVGSWELNLAAFLADLNTNEWGQIVGSGISAPVGAGNYYLYNYGINSGVAFDDARALLSYRYNFNYNNQLIPAFALNSALSDAGIDGYTVGYLMTNTILPQPVGSNLHWAGSDNTNHYFSLSSDLFNANEVQNGIAYGFINRLTAAGTNTFGGTTIPTYDRYTFYRMLDQLGTESTADNNKLNLNYSNAVVGYDANGIVTNIAIIPGAETNAVPWAATNFFNAAADRMLRAYTTNWFASNPTNFLATYYGVIFTNNIAADGLGLTNFPYLGMTNEVPAFGITNIPVYFNGQFVYTPAVNRLLQLAANIYDASTNQTAALGMNYPSVFRPMFKLNGTNLYISGYTYVATVSGVGDLNYFSQPFDAAFIANSGIANISPSVNIYGVPWIIGVKKIGTGVGFPSFNQLSLMNSDVVSRRLEMSRPVPGADINQTNQMYQMNITENLGLSFWNSYTTNYPRPLKVYAVDTISMALTNQQLGTVVWPRSGQPSYVTNIFYTNVTVWPGSQWGGLPPNLTNQPTSFVFTNFTYTFLPSAVYRFDFNGYTGFDTNADATNNWEANDTAQYPLPQLGLATTNWLQAYILDGNRVIDYVQFQGPTSVRNLNQELADPPSAGDWSTNQTGNGFSWGVRQQITTSENGKWSQNPNTPVSTGDQSTGFINFMLDQNQSASNSLVMQAPYTPTREIYQTTVWQANDPLVHYVASDLSYVDPLVVGFFKFDYTTNPPSLPSLTQPGNRYQPWGWRKSTQMMELANVDKNAYNLALQDPLVWGSDNWDFPTNQYPTVGWLGRVHRGTPWQTVYLKSSAIDANTWAQWTGDTQTSLNQYFDAAHSMPTNDWALFDLFTTGLNDNATRGTLSVNVGADQPGPTAGLAAWSALFSGMVVLTNNLALSNGVVIPTTASLIINPAGVNGANSQLGEIVTNINYTRSLFPMQAFTHVGDILSVPALTENSLFLNTNTPITGIFKKYPTLEYGISDEVYEWLPQQMMELLRVGDAPRYVVYCYGQTLKPAPNGLVLSGNFFGLCTNYQITAESATRAVIRVDAHVTVTGTNYTTTVESYNVLPPN
jgi:hypothetical protein